MSEKMLTLLGKLKRSKNRLKVFRALDGPQLPSEIVRKIYGTQNGSRYAIVSRALADLRCLKLTRVVNPKTKVGRLYILTTVGHKVKRIL